MENSKKIQFENAGPFLAGLIILALLGFWNSYFSKILNQSEEFSLYFHLHAMIALLWIFALIIQPILIRKRKFALHRKIGKFSYVLFALIFISVLLLTHSRHSISEENLAMRIFIPFKDLVILGAAYFIAIKYRKNIAIHARGMIATGIVFIEPALVRLIKNFFNAPENRYLWTIGIVYTLLIILMVVERNQKKGRWVFPLILLLYIIVHSIIVFKIPIGAFDTFSKWFIGLPLT